MEIGIGLETKGPRSSEPGLHATVKVPLEEARAAGLISDENYLGPATREFARQLADTAYAFFETDVQAKVDELQAAYECLQALLSSNTGAVTEGAIREVSERLMRAIGNVGLATMRESARTAPK